MEGNKIEYDYSRLKGRIVQEGLNNKIFANLIGISSQTLYNIFNNKTYFSQKQISKSKKILNLEDEEIYPLFFTIKVKKNFTR